MKPLAPNLVCTTGTILFYPNLTNLDPENYYSFEPSKNNSPEAEDWRALHKMGLTSDSQRRISLFLKIKTGF